MELLGALFTPSVDWLTLIFFFHPSCSIFRELTTQIKSIDEWHVVAAIGPTRNSSKEMGESWRASYKKSGVTLLFGKTNLFFLITLTLFDVWLLLLYFAKLMFMINLTEDRSFVGDEKSNENVSVPWGSRASKPHNSHPLGPSRGSIVGLQRDLRRLFNYRLYPPTHPSSGLLLWQS